MLIISITGGCRKDKNEPSVVTDGDGNEYSVITIGSRKWLGENLHSTKYNDGTPVPVVTDAAAWKSLNDAACCWYNNEKERYDSVYGVLYNWHVVNTGKICPKGWHVPTRNEWVEISFNTGGYLIAGKSLKEADTTHWSGAYWQTTAPSDNQSGFTALPGGSRSSGLYLGIRDYGAWWSSTPDKSEQPWAFILYASSIETYIDSFDKNQGFSIRCISDSD